MDTINDLEHKLDGVRLVWSLLKHPSDAVKRNACFALVPCIRYAKNSPEMVRAFVGGLELVVSLLENEDNEVLSAVCATIAEIATDSENLGILTDHGVVRKLADLVHTVSLLFHLSTAGQSIVPSFIWKSSRYFYLFFFFFHFSHTSST
jgi:hypothetical protein